MSATARKKNTSVPASYVPVNVKNEQDWLAKRQQGIGGSDAAAAIGLHPFKTPYQLYMEKTGKVVPEDLSDNTRIKFGHIMEDVCANMYEQETGRTVRRRRQIFKSKHYPFMQASIDRDIVGVKRGLECKNVDRYAFDLGDWGDSGTDEVPEYYHIQCNHYMAVMGYDAWDLAAIIGGNELRIFTIHRDEELIRQLTQLEQQFWNNFIVKKTPPPLEYAAPSTSTFLKRMYDKMEDKIEKGDSTLIHWHNVLLDARKKENEYAQVAETALNHLREAIGNARALVIPGLSGKYVRKVIHRKEAVVAASEYVKLHYKSGSR